MRHDLLRNLALASLGLGALSLQAVPTQGAPTQRRPVSIHGPAAASTASPTPARLVPRLDPRLAGLRPTRGGTSPAIEALAAQDPRFAAGLALFDKDFHAADGLGAPELNADSCRACHQDPVIGGAGGLELNVSRFADDSTGTFMNLPGGQAASKLFPPWVPGREEYDPTTATVFEQRQTPTILGAGQIDRILDSAILANEDPTDRDGNGIYGVARLRTIGGVQEVGRFGWKAQAPRLRDFVMDAMGGELGITTPDDGRGFAMLSDNDNVQDPELSTNEANVMHYFLARLPAPQRTNSGTPEVALGEALFDSIGCAVCHVPALDSSHGPVPLYSDLLLHDVMPATYRGMAEPGAGVGMFRTPPLWGIKDTAPYMHDGRASTLVAAILAHESEADGVTAAFKALSPSDQAAVVLFLEDL